jgi:hypothetical protein|tara:strand:+ start:198 stop:404 length:207 start_codon:yes stop_codon:yes gene_type:complete
MEIGNLVKIKMVGVDKEPGTGIVIGFRPRGWSRDPNPECKVWDDAIVYWSGWGVSFHMISLLEVVNVA